MIRADLNTGVVDPNTTTAHHVVPRPFGTSTRESVFLRKARREFFVAHRLGGRLRHLLPHPPSC